MKSSMMMMMMMIDLKSVILKMWHFKTLFSMKGGNKDIAVVRGSVGGFHLLFIHLVMHLILNQCMH